MSELPKLEAKSIFKRIKFSYVVKVVRSPVPPSFFLPSDVRPYKEKLDFASNGIAGSPQIAILVGGEVFDYYVGARSADELERALIAIESGAPYPFERCVRRSTWTKCQA